MNKKTIFLALTIPFLVGACSPKVMPQVPLTPASGAPCSSLAPWGFPQAENLPKQEGESRSKRKGKSHIGFICHEQMYAVGYDQSIRVPRWVQEVVSPKKWQGEPAKVRKDWRPDPFVVKSAATTPSDYSKEITKGKIVVFSLASHKNFANNELAIGRTFYMSNTAPAIVKDDRPGAWERLEDQVVAWSAQKQDLLVISGTVFAGGSPIGWTGHTEERKRGKDNHPVIAIPSHFYKVIVDLDAKSAIAFMVPNDDSPAANLNVMARRVQDVERAAGIQFFPSLSPEDRAKIVGRVNVREWPMQ